MPKGNKYGNVGSDSSVGEARNSGSDQRPILCTSEPFQDTGFSGGGSLGRGAMCCFWCWVLTLLDLVSDGVLLSIMLSGDLLPSGQG